MKYLVYFWGQGPYEVDDTKLIKPNAEPGDLLYGIFQTAILVVDEVGAQTLSMSHEKIELPQPPAQNPDAVNLEYLDIQTSLLVGNEIEIIANEAIAIDDCLHVVGDSASGLVVQKALATDPGRLPCAGFPKTGLSENETGKMWVGPHLSGVGTTDYPFSALHVGTDGKIAWHGSANAAGSRQHFNLIGTGRGVGKIQFSFSPQIDRRG